MPFDGQLTKGLHRCDSVRTERRFDWNRHYHFAPVDRLDAAENAFLDRALRHYIPTMFVREYAKLNARTIFPVYFGNDGAAETVNWTVSDEAANAEIVRDYADDAPNAEVSIAEYDSKVRSIRAAAQWTIQEIRAATKANRPLQESKVNAARDAMLRRENKIAFHGDADFGLVGLFSHDDVPRDTAAQTFAAGTADQNLGELHDLANSIADDTNDVESPKILLLPPSVHDRVSIQRLGASLETTVLQHFLATNPHIQQVIRVRELKGAGTGGTDVAVAFDRDIEKLRMNVMLDLEQFPPERRGMVVRVEYHARVGGLVVTRPKSIKILEGV